MVKSSLDLGSKPTISATVTVLLAGRPRICVLLCTVITFRLVISHVYIDGEEFEVDSGNCFVDDSGTTLVPEERTARIEVHRAYAADGHIKVVCEDGTSVEGDYKPSF